MVDYLNAPVSSLEEGLVRQLLTSEHCTSSKEEKEFVSLCLVTSDSANLQPVCIRGDS